MLRVSDTQPPLADGIWGTWLLLSNFQSPPHSITTQFPKPPFIPILSIYQNPLINTSAAGPQCTSGPNKHGINATRDQPPYQEETGFNADGWTGSLELFRWTASFIFTAKVGVKRLTNGNPHMLSVLSQLIPESGFEKHHMRAATNSLCHPLAFPSLP